MENNKKYFGGASVIHSNSNCKMSTVESIRSLFTYCLNKTPEEKLQIIKDFFSTGRILLNVHTTDKNIKNYILENFEVYSCSDIPIGYSENVFQHHILIKNNDSSFYNKQYLRPINKVYKHENLDKLNILNKLKGVRKKTDIIDKILESIKT